MSRNAERERQRIAAATGVLLSRGGLAAVSMRTVAAEASVSAGRVQHYYGTKRAMLIDALRRAYAGVEAEAAAGLPPDASPRQILERVLRQLLSDSPATIAAIRINAAFSVMADDDDEVRALLVEGDDQILEIARLVYASEVPDASASVTDLEARALFAAAQGLASSAAFYGEDRARARATLDHLLARFGRGRHPAANDVPGH